MGKDVQCLHNDYSFIVLHLFYRRLRCLAEVIEKKIVENIHFWQNARMSYLEKKERILGLTVNKCGVDGYLFEDFVTYQLVVL